MALGSSGNFRHTEGRNVWRSIHIKPPIEESKQRQKVTTESSQVYLSDDSPNPVEPTRDIDQISTEHNLKAIRKTSSLNFNMANGLPIDEEKLLRTTTTSFPNWRKFINPKLQNSEMDEYILHTRKLIRSVGIYSLASLASPLASLVLAPFLTHHLSHANYGALAVLITAIALLTGVTQLGLSFAFSRSYNYDYESQRDRFGVLSTTIDLLLLTSIFTAIVTLIAAPWLSLLLFNNSSFIIPVRLLGVVVLLQNLTVPGFAWLRAENRAALFSTLSITNLIVCIAANFILVGVLHMGISGSLIATGSGYAVVAFCTLPIIIRRAGFRLRADIVRGMLSFGLPSIFTFLSMWVLQLSDRFLLARLGSLTQTASYAVAYSLGGVLTTIVLSPFNLAWPTTMFSIAKRDDAANIFRLVFRWYGIILLFAAFGLSIASTIVLELFFPPSYQSAAPIIPIITTSVIFYGLYILFTTGISIRRKTWYAVVFTSIAALANVGLNFILIPLYGSMGAAVSTLIAYILLALISYAVNQRIYPVPYEMGIFAIGLLIGSALYIGGSFLARNEGRFEGWAIYIGALVLFSGSLIFLMKLPARGKGNKSRNIGFFYHRRIS